MDIAKFKTELKELLARNPQPVVFKIRYNRVETFTTRKEFGLRLLELFADNNVVDIVLAVAKESGCFGTMTNDFKWVSRNIRDLQCLEFNINTVRMVQAAIEQEINSTSTQRAIASFGTNA